MCAKNDGCFVSLIENARQTVTSVLWTLGVRKESTCPGFSPAAVVGVTRCVNVLGGGSAKRKRAPADPIKGIQFRFGRTRASHSDERDTLSTPTTTHLLMKRTILESNRIISESKRDQKMQKKVSLGFEPRHRGSEPHVLTTRLRDRNIHITLISETWYIYADSRLQGSLGKSR